MLRLREPSWDLKKANAHAARVRRRKPGSLLHRLRYWIEVMAG